MHIKLDSESGVPIYLQIVTQIKYMAASGALKPGDRIPSVRELAVTLRVNPNTIARAYRELQHDGTITGQWGEGNFISEQVALTAETEKKKILARLVDEMMDKASALGVPGEEITRTVAARLQKKEKK